MTGRTLHLGLDGLRHAAGLVQRVTGLRVEIAAPPPCPPPRCGKHAGNVQLLADGLRHVVPQGRAVVDGAGVELPEEAGAGHLVPDLVVCPQGFLTAEDPLLHPQDVDLAVEVVAPSAASARIGEAVGRYAAAGLRALLVVDPRAGQGRWSLYTEPIAGHYWAVRRGTDEPVPLPEPFRPGALPVDRLPRYARR